MDLHEEAVSLALSLDLELAKMLADKPKDESVKKNLWLSIVRHLVEDKKDVKG